MTENFIHIFAWHLEVLCASAGRVHRNEPRPHKVLCNNKRLSRTLQKVERHCDIFSVYTHASENNSSNILRNSSHILVESKSSNQNIIIKTHLKTSIPFSFCGFVLQHIRSQQCRCSKKTATMPPKTCSLYTYREARSGGTSMTQSHGVPARSIKNAKRIRRLGIRYFHYIYYLWETDNFPILTQLNAVCLSMTLLNIWARQFYLSRDDNDEIEHDGYRRLVNFNIFFCF